MNRAITTFLIILDLGLLIIVGNGIIADIYNRQWQNPMATAALIAVGVGLVGMIICGVMTKREVR